MSKSLFSAAGRWLGCLAWLVLIAQTSSANDLPEALKGIKQVKVLRGGMPSWLLSRQAVLGKPLDAMQSVRLSPAAIKSMIEQRRRKGSKGAPLAAVILVTAAGATPETLQRWREAAQPTPLLIYADTQDAYARQLTLQKAIWTAQAHGPKQLGCGL
ncbi:hypothetical protein [Paraherbaspirillum soli]|uniref:Uncharacterized protein n=1 Tax=Paraherbaspirillum soli TaxID=631222 RepID=A0ABW0MA25_9BURK